MRLRSRFAFVLFSRGSRRINKTPCITRFQRLSSRAPLPAFPAVSPSSFKNGKTSCWDFSRRVICHRKHGVCFYLCARNAPPLWWCTERQQPAAKKSRRRAAKQARNDVDGDGWQPGRLQISRTFHSRRKNQPKNQQKVKINTGEQQCGATILLGEKRIWVRLRRHTGAFY